MTLTGVGGVGKTRLAVHVARELRRVYRDGVWLVELADLQDPSLMASALVAALELPDASGREPMEVLVDYLTDKQLLLVLDNCEHLLPACARLIAQLLPAAPDLRILATSREPLAIPGEQVWPVPSLSLPQANSSMSNLVVHQYAALSLFEDRASAVLPGFSLNSDNAVVVAQVCQRLDGLPLAIELAAVWLRVLSLEQLLARLEDRFRLLKVGEQVAPARHQTLRAAVEWSFDLCSELERTLWARFSVFSGDFDLDAAEIVCAGNGLTVADVFTGVTGLVDKSVLVRGDGGARARYRMLETIRQYGAERLAADGEETRLRRCHRDYYLELAEQADAHSCGPRQTEWGMRLCAERANLWAALEYSLTEPGEARAGLRMAGALWSYWVACGYVRDGGYWLDRALAIDTEPSHERARALWINGWIAFLRGDNSASLVWLREARELAERLGDEAELTYALQYLAEAEMFVGNMAVAVPMLDEALSRHRASNAWTSPSLLIFGQRARPAVLAGDTDQAVALLAEALSICDSLGERWTRSWTEWNLGVAWWATGDHETAKAHLFSSLRVKQDLNDQLGIPFCVELLAWVAVSAGDARRAATLFGAAEAGWELIGRPLFGFETLLSWRDENRACCREELGERTFETAREKGARLAQDKLIAYALGEKAPDAAAAPAVPVAEQVLTRREREVAAMVARGMTNKEIADSLVIAQRTAEGHVERILSKLGFTSRTQIAVWIADRQNG